MNNILRYTLGASSWTLIAGDSSGFSGATSSLFNDPLEAIFDPMGNMYVADTNNQCIQFCYADE